MGIHPLRTARSLRNLTIQQLADEARVGASTIWRAEHNYSINSESRKRICAYFGTTSQKLGLINAGQETLASEPRTTLKPVLYEEMQAHIPFSKLSDPVLSQQSEPSYEEQIGAWLTLGANGLATLFDADWTLEEILSVLRVILRGSQSMPAAVRNTLQRVGGGKVDHNLSEKHVSFDERVHLGQVLERSVNEGWQLFHTSRPAQVLVAAQAQLYLVHQTHDLLFSNVRCSLYAGLYDLIGAAYLYQGHYDHALRAYKKAFQAAKEGADCWDMAQSQNWQAIVASTCGRYTDAIRAIETAVHLIEDEHEERFVRLHAHLLADWAYNASFLQEYLLVDEKLGASASLLTQLGPDPEFDQARWLQIAGSCMLIRGDYKAAIVNLQQSLAQLSEPWTMRRILTLVPLAEAQARNHEREASLITAERIIPLIGEIDSTMLNYRFIEYQQVLQETFPRDRQVRSFVANVQPRLLF